MCDNLDENNLPKGMQIQNEEKELINKKKEIMKTGMNEAIGIFKKASKALEKFGKVHEKNFVEIDNKRIASFTLELGGEKEDVEEKPTQG